ncbi:MAG: glutamate--tRNA ligase family protein, partial [Chromatiales bacterium]
LAYPCFCSDQTLKLARKAQLAAGRPPRYPGTCAGLSQQEVEVRLAQGLEPTLRFRVPGGEVIEFTDLVRGPQSFPAEDIGDFVIRRSDGSPAFFFSNAVDDALMGVTHVFRGEDHITNTPRQLMLLGALGLRVPQYAHIALIVGADGGPLSKRHGAQSLRGLRAEGYLPLAIVNHLARLGHVYERNELMSLDELAADFEPARLGKAPAHHDEAQLLHWQKEAVTRLDNAAFWTWLIEHDDELSGALHTLVPEAQRDVFVHCVRENVVFPRDAQAWAASLFCDPLPLSAEARSVVGEAGAGFFDQALDHLGDGTSDFRAYAKAVGAATGTKGKTLFMPLRAALTGETHGPEMARMFALIGAERARARLQAAQTLTR